MTLESNGPTRIFPHNDDLRPQYASRVGRLRGGSKDSLKRLSQGAFLDFNRDPGRTVFVAGDGRSGTTWIAEIINFNNDYRFIFEPFHPRFSPVARSMPFFYYADPNSVDTQLLTIAQRVLTGEYRDTRSDQFNKRRFASRRVIKDIFSNLMLKWLCTHFPSIRPVLIVRHPFAVAASKMGLTDCVWGVEPTAYLQQLPLMRDHLLPYRDLVVEVTDEFDAHILNWCITHFIPFRQFHRNQIHLVAFEHLNINRAREIQRLFCYLGMNGVEKACSVSMKPSATTVRSDDFDDHYAICTGWTKQVPIERQRRGLEILNAFGITLYSDDPFPLLNDPSDVLLPN